MKLSIVIYSSNNLVEIKSVISTVFSTREKEVEVLVIDESRDSTVDNLFEVFPKQIASGRLKIVSYSKISSAKSRIEALRHITGKHVLYIYGSDRIKKSFLEKMLITIDTLSPEIIEFDVEHIGNVKMNYHIPELKPNVLHSVQQTPSIVAQTSPFLYTKIFKTQFLKNNSNILDVDMNYDSYFSYLIVTMATKYIYVDIKGIRIKVNITEDTIYNLYRQWDYILRYFRVYTNYSVSRPYIEYSFLNFVYGIFIPLLESISIESFDKLLWVDLILDKILKNFPDYESNVYLQQDSKLKKLIKSNNPNKKIKHSREFFKKLDKDKNEN